MQVAGVHKSLEMLWGRREVTWYGDDSEETRMRKRKRNVNDEIEKKPSSSKKTISRLFSKKRRLLPKSFDYERLLKFGRKLK
ncbi:hypothetical protein E3N88_21990 [Mikania micrantha]|uniref:Uncharacterized protein n=1 Tax=Mikania micrantha TaxID=192012 RepID=A0A5N6NA89_9ASTR|nr:hypothetical protein E3N88_21990 [Mikania micrantha]